VDGIEQFLNARSFEDSIQGFTGSALDLETIRGSGLDPAVENPSLFHYVNPVLGVGRESLKVSVKGVEASGSSKHWKCVKRYRGPVILVHGEIKV